MGSARPAALERSTRAVVLVAVAGAAVLVAVAPAVGAVFTALRGGSPALQARVTGARIDREERKGKGASDHAPVVVDLAG